MNNLIKKISALTLVVGALGMGTVFAEEEIHTDSSDAEIIFSEEYEVEGPGEGGTEPGEETNVSGFSLWNLPKAMKFDKDIKKSGSDVIYNLKDHSTESYSNPFDAKNEYEQSIAMYDLTDNDHQWSLTVKADSLVNGSDEITGAKLSWKQDIKEVSKQENGKMMHSTSSEGVERINNPGNIEITFADNDSTTVMSANDNPRGYYDAAIKNINLLIPAKEGKANTTFSSKLVWKLNSNVKVGE